jgi:16S rRNA processing protein RimM
MYITVYYYSTHSILSLVTPFQKKPFLFLYFLLQTRASYDKIRLLIFKDVDNMEQFLEIGKIVGTHALKGELRVDPWCDSPQFLCKFKELYLDKGNKKLTVNSRPHKNIAIVKVKGVDTIEEADKLRGKILYMNRKDAKLADGEYFIQDLMGMEVLDVDNGTRYGTLTEVFKTGANDVYQVTDDNKNDYLIPVIDEVVISVNLEENTVLIRPLKGIFDDED